MSIILCPVCRNILKKSENRYICKNDHCYDIAKKGYVNLLMSQKSSKKRRGDDKLMLNSRRAFLDKGYYNVILDQIISAAEMFYSGGAYIDLGCGECWYTERIKNAVNPPQTVALDISKASFEVCDSKDIVKIVASVMKIPVCDASCGLATNIFAPINPAETKRILHKNGVLIRAVPLEKHLLSLKRAVYDNVYENAHDETSLDGFELIYEHALKKTIVIDNNEDIMRLFMMTPYYYKTSRFDFERLKSLETLETEIEINILAYKPK